MDVCPSGSKRTSHIIREPDLWVNRLKMMASGTNVSLISSPDMSSVQRQDMGQVGWKSISPEGLGLVNLSSIHTSPADNSATPNEKGGGRAPT